MDYVKEFKLNDLPSVKTDGDVYHVGDYYTFDKGDDTPEYIAGLIQAATAYYVSIVGTGENFKDRITVHPVLVGEQTNKDGWKHNLWDVLVMFDGTRTIRVPFMTGLMLDGFPERDTVMDALAGECRMLRDLGELNFDQWCLEYGYNNDSISDRETFEKVVNISNELRYLFWTSENFDKFLEVFSEEW